MLAGLKKFFSLFKNKNQRSNGYGNGDYRIQSLPGQNGQLQQRKDRLARLKQRLHLSKSNRQGIYHKPQPKKKKIARAGGAIFLTFTLLLLGFFGTGEKILERLQGVKFFQVNELVFSGCHIVTEEQLREATGIILYQTSLLNLKSTQLEKEILSVPWVEKAKVKRNWPSTVEISIVESIPVALLHSTDPDGTHLQYIDRKGSPLLPVTPGSDVDFPVITGLSSIADAAAREKAFADVLVLMKKVEGNDPHLPAHSVSEIHVDPNGEMVVYMVEYPFPIFFGNGNTKKKYARLVQVLKALYKKREGKNMISQVKYIQMDYLEDKVLVAQR